MGPDRTKKWLDGRANFGRALANLLASVAAPITEKRDLSGIIKDFELAYELSWKTLKTLLLMKGHDAQAARDVFKIANQLGMLDDEATWLDIIEDRNRTVQTYDEAKARAMVEAIKQRYVGAFQDLAATFAKA